MSEKSENQRLIQESLNRLAEHFDTVHIFATLHDGAGDKTNVIQMGTGNSLTRFGQISLWVEEVKQIERNKAGENEL